ncbi:MAG: Hpt domain-containing protein [Acidobacteriaceae bacterium]|nr:Hpt domain-containing protein [Acidobacteriaceae bacterium]
MKTASRIIQELIPGYLDARRKEIPTMMELLAASDFERLRVLSHNLKGSGASFGFSELTRFGAALEGYAEAWDPASFQVELGRLKEYLEQLNPATNTNL